MKNRLQTNQVVSLVAALLVTLVMLFPIYWILVSSFKTDAEIFATPPTLFPHQPSLAGYLSSSENGYSVGRAFVNSCLISLPSCLIALVLGVPAGYSLARYRPKGEHAFLMVFLVTQMLPVSLILTPLFILYKSIGLLNTFLAPILSSVTISVPFIVLMLRPYFLQMPHELEEAALIDGCGQFRAFLQIYLPIAAPGLVVAATFSFLFAWNDMIFSLTFISRQENRPLTAGIVNFLTQYGIKWNNIMAFGSIVVLPVIVLFTALQRQIVAGLTSGAIKE